MECPATNRTSTASVWWAPRRFGWSRVGHERSRHGPTSSNSDWQEEPSELGVFGTRRHWRSLACTGRGGVRVLPPEPCDVARHRGQRRASRPGGPAVGPHRVGGHPGRGRAAGRVDPRRAPSGRSRVLGHAGLCEPRQPAGGRARALALRRLLPAGHPRAAGHPAADLRDGPGRSVGRVRPLGEPVRLHPVPRLAGGAVVPVPARAPPSRRASSRCGPCRSPTGATSCRRRRRRSACCSSCGSPSSAAMRAPDAAPWVWPACGGCAPGWRWRSGPSWR